METEDAFYHKSDEFNSSDRLSIGSLIFADNYFVNFSTYQHYGVYIGNNKVVHFASPEGQEISFENAIIHETTLENFLKGRELQIDNNVEKMFDDEEIVIGSRSRINEMGYNLFTNNCEHFARWCVTGENQSYQIQNLPFRIYNAILFLKENQSAILRLLELFFN